MQLKKLQWAIFFPIAVLVYILCSFFIEQALILGLVFFILLFLYCAFSDAIGNIVSNYFGKRTRKRDKRQ